MIRAAILRVLPPLVFLAFASCTNMSTLQTGSVMVPGEGHVTFGGGVVRYQVVDEILKGIKSDSGGLNIPFVDIAMRLGIAPRLDIGARLTPPFGADIKYQLVDAGMFATSIGAGLGLGGVILGVPLIDATVPLILSLEPSKYFGFYVAPRYYLRSFGSSTHFVAATGGVKIGNEVGLYLEGTYFYDVGSKKGGHQINGALAIRWGTDKRVSKDAPERKVIDPLDAMTSKNPTLFDAEDSGSRVLKLGKNRLVLVSHPTGRTWQAGDPACVRSPLREPACGLIQKANKKGAVLELDGSSESLKLGDVVASP